MVIDQRVRVLGDRYEVGPVIGSGGMGVVHRGRDLRLSREVAIKVLPSAGSADPGRRMRFEREARATARVSHPNVVAVYDEGAAGDELYFVMESLPGRTLADELASGTLTGERARQIALDLLAGLAAAHREGVLHRDIKPGNVLMTASGSAKLSDFGIAKVAGATDLTQVGMLFGTAPYLPPERLRGEPATQSGDVYAIGAMLYEALAGRHPFAGDTPVAIATAMAMTTPAPIATVRPDVDADLGRAVDRAISRDPAARFPSASAMADALRVEPVASVLETVPLATAPTAQFVAVPPTSLPPERTRTSSTRRRVALLLLAVAIVALSLAGLFALASDGHPGGPTTTSSVPPTTQVPVTTPTVPPSTVPSTTIVPTTVKPPPPPHHHKRDGKHQPGG